MKNFIKLDMYNGHTTLVSDPNPKEFIGMISEPKGYMNFTNVWSRPGWMLIEIPKQLHDPIPHSMNLAGKEVVEYETDAFGYSKKELAQMIKNNELCFTYAEFANGKELSDEQLMKLSKKYPDVLADLISDLVEETA